MLVCFFVVVSNGRFDGSTGVVDVPVLKTGRGVCDGLLNGFLSLVDGIELNDGNDEKFDGGGTKWLLFIELEPDSTGASNEIEGVRTPFTVFPVGLSKSGGSSSRVICGIEAAAVGIFLDCGGMTGT